MAENENLDQVKATGSDTPASDKKEKTSAKKSKPGVFARIKQWCKETKAELKKVQWPSWKQTLNNTLIVLVFCVIVGICIFLFDKLADGLLGALINLFKG